MKCIEHVVVKTNFKQMLNVTPANMGQALSETNEKSLLKFSAKDRNNHL